MDARLPDESYNYVREFLPPQPTPGPQVGRRRIDSFTVLKVIWFVLTVGCRWRDVPKELACSGETARTRLKEWQEAGVWKRLHQRLREEINRWVARPDASSVGRRSGRTLQRVHRTFAEHDLWLTPDPEASCACGTQLTGWATQRGEAPEAAAYMLVEVEHDHRGHHSTG